MGQSDTSIGFQLLTVKQAAARLSCSPAVVYEHIQNGDMVVTRIGRQKGYRIDVRDLDAFVNSRKFSGAPVAERKPRPRLKHLRF